MLRSSVRRATALLESRSRSFLEYKRGFVSAEIQTDETMEDLAKEALEAEKMKQAEEERKRREAEKKKKMKKRKRKCEYLPLGFRKHVKTYKSKGTVMPPRALLDFIDEVYHEKIMYDEVDDRDGHPRHSMVEFVYDHLFRRYGLRSLADSHTYDLVASLRAYKDHPRVVLFSRLVGVCKEEEILPQDATDFVLYVEAYLHALHDEKGRTFIHDDTAVGRDRHLHAISHIPLHIALKVAPAVLSVLIKNGPDLTSEVDVNPVSMLQRIQKHIQDLTFEVKTERHGKNKEVDIDRLMLVFVGEFMSVRKMVENLLCQIFISGDTNSDGVLSLDEFIAVIRSINPSCSENQANRMFKEALQAAVKLRKRKKALGKEEPLEMGKEKQITSISPEVFLLCATKHGFLSGDHRTYMPPRPMSKKDFVRDSAGHENYGAMIDDVTNMSHLSDWDQMKKLAHERSLTKRASFHSAAYDLVKQKVDALLQIQGGQEHHPLAVELQDLQMSVEDKIRNGEAGTVIDTRQLFHELTRKAEEFSAIIQGQDLLGGGDDGDGDGDDGVGDGDGDGGDGDGGDGDGDGDGGDSDGNSDGDRDGDDSDVDGNDDHDGGGEELQQ